MTCGGLTTFSLLCSRAVAKSEKGEIFMAAVTEVKYVGTITKITTTKNDDGSVKVSKDNFSEATPTKSTFVSWMDTVKTAINT